jgi:hypothetical protein
MVLSYAVTRFAHRTRRTRHRIRWSRMLLHCSLRCHPNWRPCNFADSRSSAARTAILRLRSVLPINARRRGFPDFIYSPIRSRRTRHHAADARFGWTRLRNGLRCRHLPRFAGRHSGISRLVLAWLRRTRHHAPDARSGGTRFRNRLRCRNLRRVARPHAGFTWLVLPWLRRTRHHSPDTRFGLTCTRHSFRISNPRLIATGSHRGVSRLFLTLLPRSWYRPPWHARRGILNCALGIRPVRDATLSRSVMRCRPRRRCNPRNDWTLDRSRRRNDGRSIRIDAQPAFAGRFQFHPVLKVRAIQASRIFICNRDHRLSHWTRVHDRSAIDCRDSTRSLRVGVVERFDVLASAISIPVVVVIVGDVCDVGDPRVRNVHVAEVSTATAIPRNVRLAIAQRTPSIPVTEANRDTNAAAKPSD